MNSTLLAKELKSNAFVAIIIFAVLGMYIACIVMMFDPSLGESLNMMMDSMPELFAAFGMGTQATTLLDFMLNYLYGFLLTVFPFVLILIMANKLMVRYLDRGTMSYLLATPNSRVRVALTLAGAMIIVLALLMVLTTAAEIACAELMFPGDLDIPGLFRANVGLFCLWTFLAGMCFFSACTFSNAGAALWVGGGAGIAFFLMQMVAKVGDKLAFLDKVNPLALFDSYGLATSDASAYAGSAILLALGIALFALAIGVFNRRDLSI
ncbi:hypothetical protein C1879_11865 [Paraeggerthella hongkongensis]|uniref:ABC transporter permease subunit n=1 Tax=Paraeggerthella sp. TaxID=2897350 RepID=UPI000DF85435|nr:hypothetical protein C1879_11865 [Paraeggerthella hongkongensis]